jgi:hypothetical protein
MLKLKMEILHTKDQKDMWDLTLFITNGRKIINTDAVKSFIFIDLMLMIRMIMVYGVNLI